MSERHEMLPHEPDEADRTLDLYLASLQRFEPSPGFADRVMARVARGTPTLAVATRPSPIVATLRRSAVAWGLTGSAAASSTALTVWVIANLESIAAGLTAMTVQAAATSWQALLGLMAIWSAWVGAASTTLVASVGAGTMMTYAALAVLSVPLSTLGLLLALRPATPSRMRSYGSR